MIAFSQTTSITRSLFQGMDTIRTPSGNFVRANGRFSGLS